jgi:hypothetical protein
LQELETKEILDFKEQLVLRVIRVLLANKEIRVL